MSNFKQKMASKKIADGCLHLATAYLQLQQVKRQLNDFRHCFTEENLLNASKGDEKYAEKIEQIDWVLTTVIAVKLVEIEGMFALHPLGEILESGEEIMKQLNNTKIEEN